MNHAETMNSAQRRGLLMGVALTPQPLARLLTPPSSGQALGEGEDLLKNSSKITDF